jgi:uncharacterized SAM-dependent methyltransferase
MHLVSQREQTVHLAGEVFTFGADETIHTESSYEYGVEQFRGLAVRAGFAPEAVWTDPQGLFSVHLLRVGWR